MTTTNFEFDLNSVIPESIEKCNVAKPTDVIKLNTPSNPNETATNTTTPTTSTNPNTQIPPSPPVNTNPNTPSPTSNKETTTTNTKTTKTDKKSEIEVKTELAPSTPTESNYAFIINTSITSPVEKYHKVETFGDWLCVQKDEKTKPAIIKKIEYISLSGNQVEVINSDPIKKSGLYRLISNHNVTYIKINKDKASLVGFTRDGIICNYKDFELPKENGKKISMTVKTKVADSNILNNKLSKDLTSELMSINLHKPNMINVKDVNDFVFNKLNKVKEHSYIEKLFFVCNQLAKECKF